MGHATFSVYDFKEFFQRDFPYGTDVEDSIIDNDIRTALDSSARIINHELFGAANENEDFFVECLMYLTAHNLVINIRNSSSGLTGKFEGLLTNKSISSVSASLSLPDDILQSSVKSQYFQTNYGAKYYHLISPLLIGNCFISEGATKP